ncbi:LptA/OstA family protein [Granulicella pectinivorans]|nr:LptA/OstA family protein [Granulicella pectinivorans]
MMRTSVEKLRLGLVAVAALLVLVVAGFLSYAHYRSKNFIKNLPKTLGANITREANGYTWSQTVQGRTVFTLHAAKLEQKQDGKYTLHDVGIVLYGRKQDRTDRIYGNEFEYDQQAGIVRGVGEVHMDLQAPASSANGERKDQPVGGDEAGMIHVLTSGLVYLEKLGVAATSEDIEFSQKEMKGWAHGADYNADSGVLVLQSAVRMNGLTKSGPVVMTASRAEWNRRQQVLNLTQVKSVTTGETIEAEHAVVNLTQAGQPQRMEADGHVSVARAEGGLLQSARADVAFWPNGKAKDARFNGGVVYTDDDDAKHARGTSDAAHVVFDGAGLADRMVMTGGAELQMRQKAAASDAWSQKNVSGQTVDVALGAAAGPAGKRQIRDAEATGGARVVAVSEGVKTRTEMTGDDLKAHFLAGNRVERVEGTGHTVLHQLNAEGVDEVSSGDTTELLFRAATVKGRAKTASSVAAGAEELVSAVQVGHVSTVRKRMKVKTVGAAPVLVEERATADRAAFDADLDQVTLTGGVQLTNVGSTLWGGKVVVERGTGNATAEGGVRVNYAQVAKDGKDGEPVHVLADHAELKRGTPVVKGAKNAPDDVAFFYGVTGKPARLWQGGSQVQAPVLKFEEGVKRLTANGPGPGMVVHTVLVGAAKAVVVPKADAPKKDGKGPGVVRVASREMVYTDGLREVVFSGGVVVEDAGGSMKAQKATAYLSQPPSTAGAVGKTLEVGSSAAPRNDKTAKTDQPFLGGSVERVVAVGKVEIDQPGKHGAGEELVYTASDQMFVLTGTKETPPRMEDETRGTVTGESIRFHSGDDSVVVTGESIEQGKGKAAGKRTETRVKQ